METHRQTSSKTVRSSTTKRSIKWVHFPFIALLRLYRYCLSPLLGPRCRFEPSCSVYSEQAITEYGVIKGLYLSARRLCKCHPWHHGGYDPVQPKNHSTSSHN